MPEEFDIIAVNVGNSRTQIGLYASGEMHPAVSLGNDNPAATVEKIAAWWKEIPDHTHAAVVFASVNDPVAARLIAMVEDQLSIEAYRIGDDLPVPVATCLDPETITGADRLLNALAAFERMQQACIVVDAGTAITVDFVDGEGTFHGGAIAPGASLQLRALHEHTAALPELRFQAPKDEDAFGRSTAAAMQLGVAAAARGMVWRLVERYAQAYGAFPPVVATGGDAEALFRGDALVDRIVPNLTLLGIVAAAKLALAADDADAETGR
jgi:type III pantothenate kinase